MLRAEALVPASGRSGVENGTFWRQQALSVVRCLLHAAALDGRPPEEIYRWSHSAAGAKEAVAILTRDSQATPGWDRALDSVVSADQRTRDSVWAMVANTFAPLADPAVLAAVSPREGDEFDPAAFVRNNGTLYLLGSASGAAATASLVAALVEDVVDVAKRVAARSAAARLDPPLALLLDEAANYPLPSLPALISEGGGSGITTLAVLQSLAQARDRWGREAADAMWDSAIVKIILGGSANAEDLAGISRLIGEREVRDMTHTRGQGRCNGYDRLCIGASPAHSRTLRYPPATRGAGAALAAVGAAHHDDPEALDGAARRPRAGCRSDEIRDRDAGGQRCVTLGLARAGRDSAYCVGSPTAAGWPATSGSRCAAAGMASGFDATATSPSVWSAEQNGPWVVAICITAPTGGSARSASKTSFLLVEAAMTASTSYWNPIRCGSGSKEVTPTSSSSPCFEMPPPNPSGVTGGDFEQ